MNKYKSIHRKDRCPVCGRYENRTLAIDAIITNVTGILLIKRNTDPDSGKWALPGGHIDFDETLDETVIREVKEETDLEVISSKFMNIYSRPDRNPHQNIAAAYIVQATGVPVAGSDASEISYFSFDRLPLPLAFDHEVIIRDYLKRLNGGC